MRGCGTQGRKAALDEEETGGWGMGGWKGVFGDGGGGGGEGVVQRDGACVVEEGDAGGEEMWGGVAEGAGDAFEGVGGGGAGVDYEGGTRGGEEGGG